jgi:hypothetical protein
MNIIQTWKTNEIPPHYQKFVQKVRNYHPDASHLFFTDEAIIVFIKQFFPEYYETFLNLRYKIQQIDFFRYLAVYHYGGVYLDLDMDLSQNMNDLDLSRCTFPIEIKNTDETILLGNYAFYSPKGHPFLKHIIDSIANPLISIEEIQLAQETHTDDKDHVYVYFTTGPELVTRAYWTYPDKENVKLLEPNPYRNDCFGKYGRHCSYGSWKHPSSDKKTI